MDTAVHGTLTGEENPLGFYRDFRNTKIAPSVFGWLCETDSLRVDEIAERKQKCAIGKTVAGGSPHRSGLEIGHTRYG